MKGLEDAYMAAFWARQRAQWSLYSGEPAIAAADTGLSAARNILECPTLPDRRSFVLHLAARRDAVDLEPAVKALRDQLDSDEGYDAGLDLHEKAARMTPDVLQLMRLREAASVDLGAESFPALALASEELDAHWLSHFLDDFLEKNLPTARGLAASLGLNPVNWFRELDSLAGPPPLADPMDLWTQLVEMLRPGELPAKPSLVVEDRELAGYTGVLHVPDDVRILARPAKSLHQWLTLAHEMGHALRHLSCRQYGVLATWTTDDDETSAIIVEHLVSAALLPDALARPAGDIQLLEAVRCAISARFELDLWENQDSAQQLYSMWYGRLMEGPLDPTLWALDSFRSIDPMCVFSYVVGYHAATRALRMNIQGPELVQFAFAPGRSQPFMQ